MRLRRSVVLGGALGTLFALALGVAGCKQATRKYWISEMGKKGPERLCKEGTYFRVCFAVSKDECLAVMTDKTKACLEKYRSQIPKVLMQPDDGRKWGGKVGACAGQAYEHQLKAKMQMNRECRAVIQSLKNAK